MYNSNKNCNNDQKEVFYLGQRYHNNPFTDDRCSKKNECNGSTHLSWHCCDETPSCCQHTCEKGATGCAGATGCTGHTGATGATGPGFNSYLNGVITTDKLSVPVGSTIIYDTVNIIGPDYSYNQQTGIFRVNTTGVYVFDWKMSVTPDPGTVSIQIDMLKFPGSTFIGGISITATNPTLNGSNIVYAATAGDTFGFVNNSNGPISVVLVGLLGPIGTVSIHRIA